MVFFMVTSFSCLIRCGLTIPAGVKAGWEQLWSLFAVGGGENTKLN